MLFCPSISQTYYSNSDLFNHRRVVHLKELPYKCQKNSNCTRRFATASNAATPHGLCTTKEGRNSLNNKLKVCYLCSKTFHGSPSLRLHLSEHTLETHYKCALCHNPFTTSSTLQYHILSVHLKERYFNCNECGHRFYTSIQLNIHKEKKHT